MILDSLEEENSCIFKWCGDFLDRNHSL